MSTKGSLTPLDAQILLRYNSHSQANNRLLDLQKYGLVVGSKIGINTYYTLTDDYYKAISKIGDLNSELTILCNM